MGFVKNNILFIAVVLFVLWLYFLIKPTNVVKEFVLYIMKELSLIRLEAFVFHPNIASTKVLLKNGFELEGTCKKYYLKNGECFDRLIFAKVL